MMIFRDESNILFFSKIKLAIGQDIWKKIYKIYKSKGISVPCIKICNKNINLKKEKNEKENKTGWNNKFSFLIFI